MLYVPLALVSPIVRVVERSCLRFSSRLCPCRSLTLRHGLMYVSPRPLIEGKNWSEHIHYEVQKCWLNYLYHQIIGSWYCFKTFKLFVIRQSIFLWSSWHCNCFQCSCCLLQICGPQIPSTDGTSCTYFLGENIVWVG